MAGDCRRLGSQGTPGVHVHGLSHNCYIERYPFSRANAGATLRGSRKLLTGCRSSVISMACIVHVGCVNEVVCIMDVERVAEVACVSGP